MTDLQAIVVGAGAAGICAGLALAELGVPFRILEAAPRIGGRAYTDRTSLTVPWDHGCHWLHDATANPLVDWADRLGARYVQQERVDHFALWQDGRFISKPELEEARQATLDAYARIVAAAKAGTDIALTELLQLSGRWANGVECVLRTVGGQEPRRISSLDFGRHEGGGGDWPVTSGYGSLFAAMARSLPIDTGAPVTFVEEVPDGIRVSTARGTLTAQVAVLTASTNVLASGSLRIAGGLAADVQASLAQIPCGAYEKVAYELEDLPSEVRGKLFCMVDPGDQPACDIEVVDGMPGQLVVHVAGDQAAELSARGRDALIDHTDGLLRLTFGNQLLDRVLGKATTNWTQDPWIRGSYSNASPGHARLHEEIIASDTGRIVFAGEAFSQTAPSTAHGAFVRGQEVIKRLKPYFDPAQAV